MDFAVPADHKWQQRWNRNTNNKLFQLKPFLGEWPPAFQKSWKNK